MKSIYLLFTCSLFFYSCQENDVDPKDIDNLETIQENITSEVIYDTLTTIHHDTIRTVVYETIYNITNDTIRTHVIGDTLEAIYTPATYETEAYALTISEDGIQFKYDDIKNNRDYGINTCLFEANSILVIDNNQILVKYTPYWVKYLDETRTEKVLLKDIKPLSQIITFSNQGEILISNDQTFDLYSYFKMAGNVFLEIVDPEIKSLFNIRDYSEVRDMNISAPQNARTTYTKYEGITYQMGEFIYSDIEYNVVVDTKIERDSVFQHIKYYDGEELNFGIKMKYPLGSIFISRELFINYSYPWYQPMAIYETKEIEALWYFVDEEDQKIDTSLNLNIEFSYYSHYFPLGGLRLNGSGEPLPPDYYLNLESSDEQNDGDYDGA